MTVKQTPDLAWNPITFANANWINYDTTQYGPCLYAKDELGFVHLRGLFACTLATGSPPGSQTIFTVPVGFRPVRAVIWPMFANFGMVDGRMNGDGTFVYNVVVLGAYSGSNYISLADMMWWAGQ